jgi:hypothetical protein
LSIIDRNEYDCPNCHNKLTITVYDSVNVGTNPELKELVLAGKVNSTVCPECGKRIVINQPFMYHDMANRLVIYYFTDRTDRDELAASSAMFTVFGDYTLRYVDRLPELIEKIKMFDSGLNDIAIQLLKMNLYNNEALNKGNSIAEIAFLLFEEGAIVFQVAYTDGTSQIISIGHETYLEIYESLKQLKLLARDRANCICVNEEYLMDLLKEYL